MIDKLVLWLREQIAADEKVALATTAPHWYKNGWELRTVPEGDRRYRHGDPAWWKIASYGDISSATIDEFKSRMWADFSHIELHQPSRVLAEIEAKRQLIDLVLDMKHTVVEDPWYTCGAATEDRDGGKTGRDYGLGCDCGLEDRQLAILVPMTLPYGGLPQLEDEGQSAEEQPEGDQVDPGDADSESSDGEADRSDDPKQDVQSDGHAPGDTPDRVCAHGVSWERMSFTHWAIEHKIDHP